MELYGMLNYKQNNVLCKEPQLWKLIGQTSRKIPQPKQLKAVSPTIGIILPKGIVILKTLDMTPQLWTVSGLVQPISLLLSFIQEEKSVCHFKVTLRISLTVFHNVQDTEVGWRDVSWGGELSVVLNHLLATQRSRGLLIKFLPGNLNLCC